ncbi:9001_t:CDS:1, partial [Acaulospora morrowiae]
FIAPRACFLYYAPPEQGNTMKSSRNKRHSSMFKVMSGKFLRSSLNLSRHSVKNTQIEGLIAFSNVVSNLIVTFCGVSVCERSL